MTDIGKPFRIHIAARQQQIGAAPHIKNLLDTIVDLRIAKRIGVADKTRSRDRAIGQQRNYV